ncbi:MAG: hypothetical protein IPN29_03340 [Saprospiraceae bacterium]|nr:hypothetical protein [Saprospiraceae bacterium]
MKLLCWKLDTLGHMTRLIWLAFLSLTLSCTENKNNAHQSRSFGDTFSGHPRLAAEWEPASGTMVTWPLSVPYRLVAELAKDNHLFTLVENEAAKTQATSWYTKWGIDLKKNTFVMVPQDIDAWWVL